MSRLQEQYKTEILQNLQSKLNCNNIHEVPKISKIVLNIGLGEAKDDAKIICVIGFGCELGIKI